MEGDGRDRTADEPRAPDHQEKTIKTQKVQKTDKNKSKIKENMV